MKAVAQILTAFGLLAIAGSIYFGVMQAQSYVQNQARHNCAQDYRLEYFDANTNTTVVKPIDDLYQACLTDKGL